MSVELGVKNNDGSGSKSQSEFRSLWSPVVNYVSNLNFKTVTKHPTSCLVAVNKLRLVPVRFMGSKHQLFGEKEAIWKVFLDYEFSLSPRAFYQLNRNKLRVLYSEAVKALEMFPQKIT